jgi:DNA-binding MarR family transcriptional regulator
MCPDELDPLIHAPTRLRIMGTLASLRSGDTISFTRLQELIGLTPGNLITHLRKLEVAGYIATEKSGNGSASLTTAVLTTKGRQALDAYRDALKGMLEGL